MRKGRDLRDTESRQAAEAQRALLERASVVVSARAGSNGRLFGSVSEADIVNALRTATNISLDRRMIHMVEHIKEVGTANVTATLFDGVVATLNVEVVAK
jgi:large subunit ribosomal protein L9